MCAAVEAMRTNGTHPGVNGSDKGDDMITACFEAAHLFSDDGRQREFAPAAAVRAMPGLREQRTTRQYCDVVFRASDGVEIWAHRFVMSAKYSGCYALFTVARDRMTPEQKDDWTPPIRAVLKDLEGDMIELLVAFAYYTPLYERVNQRNVVKVLDLSEMLKIPRMRDHCLKTLKQDLAPENCIGTYHLGTSRGYQYLSEEAFRYFLRNFDKVWRNSAQFEALTPEEMRTILEDNRLYAPSELEDVLKAILKWVSADVDQRKGYLAKFLPLVRFAHCSAAEFEMVFTFPEVHGDGDSLEVLGAIHQSLTGNSLLVGHVAGVDLSSKLWLTPRLPKDILFLFGGWTTGASNVMHTYNCRARTWRVMGHQYTTPRAYHGAAVINSCIYYVGGFNGRECYHSVVCFDVPMNRWSAKANMAYARCYVSVVVLDGHIYAMGGFDGRARTNTVERAGGFTGIWVVDNVECYDPSTNAWTRVLTMSTPRSGLRVVVHNDALYIIGGYNGNDRLSSMELLDVRRGQFTRLPSMLQAKSNFSAVILEGNIYTIGGFDGNVYVNH
ncbi:hypothetical protein HPB50_004644 [Hyalomma asiaticum]|uniref:Uncharacterized protein n=1 Tax=Hyalomma asiaticum TaxID=266040 RepID=A0ACB7T3E4_HYAAI|nr:hypothetical protein HPB50_004644 [Hyalomma asiaticum]